MSTKNDLELRAIKTLRYLSADGVQTANSGHPGLPMGTAAIAYTIWTRHLKINPAHPNWFNRDRFILSGGHGSMLIYSLLHLTGFDLSLDELKHFRQWGSRTPGHPEYGLTPGVEVTTGPLGQGFANGVGMAIAEAHLAAEFNEPQFDLVDHYVYAIVTDGDLMEGVASEAASLAGTLKLGKLIYLYDDNHISIDGSTDLSFTEERTLRFEAYGWHVQKVADGNDVEAIDAAINAAKKDPRPSLIACRTHIGFSLPTKQDTAAAHGTPPGWKEIDASKEAHNWPVEPHFYIPEDVLEHYRAVKQNGIEHEKEWQALFTEYQKKFPEKAAELKRRMEGKLPAGWDSVLPEFPADPKGMATRISSGKVINALVKTLPEMMGGSADLTPSTKTWIDQSSAFSAENRSGANLHFGVREHGMGSILNGMAVHKGLIPFGATFLVFSDYLRPAIRVSAISHYPVIWVFTHDSIGLGEDGPTHQPIEHLAALRAIPNLVTIRPADANETREAWKAAVQRKEGPTALILSRQDVPTLDRGKLAPAEGLHKGAYVLTDLGKEKSEIILMATGSEVQLILDAAAALAEKGKNVRVVSFPSWELFEKQSKEYQDSVLIPTVKCRMAVEAGIKQGWEKWLGENGVMIGMSSYGASAPAEILYEKFGFSVENIVKHAMQMLA
ncbi:MAG: transketolase [Anaerolineaceae bacterium]|nr:MAG: transketolase [Anaerolineaceae bacterium]